MATPMSVGILVFDGVEVLDFAGPFEVFSRARLEPGVESRRSDIGAPFEVFTVAATAKPVVATGGLRIIPRCDFETCPRLDILVVPGGLGTRALLDESGTMSWLRDAAAEAQKVVSVCTGALLLARAGLLAGRAATTHWAALSELAGIDPTISVRPDDRVVDAGIVTSAGVSAGLDMALYVVACLLGPSASDDTARYMDYRRPEGLVSAYGAQPEQRAKAPAQSQDHSPSR